MGKEREGCQLNDGFYIPWVSAVFRNPGECCSLAAVFRGSSEQVFRSSAPRLE